MLKVPMQRKTITVTEQQNFWIKSQIDSGKYGNDSEYLRELIRLDQEHKQKIAVLRSALIEGEKSGISKRSMDDILKDAKKRHSLNV
ncbi:antitoxin ParD1/3/4 [Bathymodiolus platifrons methanotrophic gill symbiont]|nr:antitoxin ParD1/3/4 [Bathymodiolus platifrons methanotrophic gill symbiont]GFO75653.1 antitoxin ParD1/3/4 [Bathymodiolus platifrons methanotrophic gill symbiont]